MNSNVLVTLSFRYYFEDTEGTLVKSSFPVIHKVGNVLIFVLLKYENKLNVVFSHITFISKHHGKRKFAINSFRLQQFPIYSHQNLYKNDNFANFVYYEKTWIC